MNKHIQKLLTHLSERTPQACTITGEDLLEHLWFTYLEETSADPQEIRAAFREIDSLLQPLPKKDANHLWDLICKVCYVHQHISFLDGVTLGAQLHTALENGVEYLNRPDS